MRPMSLKTDIRHARIDDSANLVALQRGIYEEGTWFVGDGPPTAGEIRRHLEYLDRYQSLMLVAVNGEQVCGWLELNRFRPMTMSHVVVLTLAVAAPYRRQGIGRALMRRGCYWALGSGVKKISLHVRAHNLAAIEFYKGEGFILEGCERDHLLTEEGLEDNFIMALMLGQKRD